VPERSSSTVHVVAGVLIDAADRVLIAQRPPGKHMAGGWEFPGGKLEPGEDRRAGLARELREELGIDIRGPLRPLIRVTHEYPSRTVLLDTWVVPRFRGLPRGLDGQALRWCPRRELADADLLPADAPIVAALRLPGRLTRSASRGYALVDFRSLAARLGPRVPSRRDAAPAAPGTMAARPSSSPVKLLGTLCATAREAESAWRRGADFVVLCMRLPPSALSRLCRAVPVPVYAHGVSLAQAWALGATGSSELTIRHRAASRRDC
jgi:mutator protein MutT